MAPCTYLADVPALGLTKSQIRGVCVAPHLIRATNHRLTQSIDNHFLQLDLTASWQISSPLLTGLAEPSDLPSVANGFLWNSYDSLFLYGGQFSDAPATSPEPFALWQYDIDTSAWIEHPEPTTLAGDNGEDDGKPVQRASEGAGVSVASLGRGWYFGGHLDGYTTIGWSQSTPRVYLKSLIEYTFPGRTNDAVTSLENGVTAGPDGAWRNITEGGLQDAAGFTERADGLLVYVPGFGQKGILLGLAGGTNATFVSPYKACQSRNGWTTRHFADEPVLPDADECDRCIRHSFLFLVQASNYWQCA